MSFSVIITQSAQDELRKIYLYIHTTLKAPNAAVRIFNKIEKSVFSLDTDPLRCRLYDKEPWRSKGFRVMVIEKYLAFYTVDENENTVIIHHIIYGARNIDEILMSDDE